MAKPKGTHRTLVGIDYVPDEAMHQRLISGENIPWEERGTVRVEAGQVFTPPPWVISALGDRLEVLGG